MKLFELTAIATRWLGLNPGNDLLDVRVVDQYGREYRVKNTNCSFTSFNIYIEPKE